LERDAPALLRLGARGADRVPLEPFLEHGERGGRHEADKRRGHEQIGEMHANSVAAARRPVNVQRAIRHLGPPDARTRTTDARAFPPGYPAGSVISWTAASRRENTAMSVIAAEQVTRVSYREAGAGNAVVCLHASASSSAQWRPLMDRLAGRFHTLAADLYGSGPSPAWPGEPPVWPAAPGGRG